MKDNADAGAIRERRLLTSVDPGTENAMDVVVMDRKTKQPLRPGCIGLVPGPGASARVRKKLTRPLIFG